MPARIPLFIVAVALFASGCDTLTHGPSGSNPVTVSPEAAPVEIDLNSAPDTLIVWDRITLRYSFPVSESRALERVEVRIGDEVVATTTNPSEIEVPTGVVADGTYPLRVVAVTASGTGSLADRLGAETTSGDVTRVVIVDNAPVEATPVTFGEAEGFLDVQWEPRPRPSFAGYQLFRVDGGGQRTLVATIDDPGTTSWRDEDFFSGRAAYAVDVLARGTAADGPPTIQDYEAPTLLPLDLSVSGRVGLSWTEAPFPGTLRYYEVAREANYSGGHGIIARITDAADTTLTVTVDDVFASEYTYVFTSVTERPSEVRGGRQFVPSEDAEAPMDVVFGATDDAFYGRDGVDIVRVSSETLTTDARFTAGREIRYAGMSRGGEHVAVLWDTGPDARLTLLDGPTLTGRATSRVADLIGDRATLSLYIESLLTTDGDLISTYGEYWSPAFYAGLGIVRLDLEAGALTGRIDAEGTRPPSFNVRYESLEYVTGTPDGRYVVVGLRNASRRLYEVTADGSFVEVTGIPTDRLAGVDVMALSNTEIAVVDATGTRVTILALPSLAEVSRPPIPRNTLSLTYDPTTDLLVATSYSLATPDVWIATGFDRTGTVVFSVPGITSMSYIGGVLWAGSTYRRVVPRTTAT